MDALIHVNSEFAATNILLLTTFTSDSHRMYLRLFSFFVTPPVSCLLGPFLKYYKITIFIVW